MHLIGPCWAWLLQQTTPTLHASSCCSRYALVWFAWRIWLTLVLLCTPSLYSLWCITLIAIGLGCSISRHLVTSCSFYFKPIKIKIIGTSWYGLKIYIYTYHLFKSSTGHATKLCISRGYPYVRWVRSSKTSFLVCTSHSLIIHDHVQVLVCDL